jgi:hypothetical protein
MSIQNYRHSAEIHAADKGSAIWQAEINEKKDITKGFLWIKESGINTILSVRSTRLLSREDY